VVIYTKHALTVMDERGILRQWVEAVLDHPDWSEADATQDGVLFAFGRIADFGDRILRVVYGKDPLGIRVITAFFDRGKKGPPQ